MTLISYILRQNTQGFREKTQPLSPKPHPGDGLQQEGAGVSQQQGQTTAPSKLRQQQLMKRRNQP